MAMLFKTTAEVQPITQPQAGSIAWLNDCIERSKAAPFSEVTMLTPAIAAELLRRNDCNRPLIQDWVETIASDIIANNWQLSMQTIIVSNDGALNDGQHRCHGVIAANRSIPVNMAFGAKRSTREVVDIGRKRTAGAILAMDGTPDGNNQSAIARLLIAYEAGDGTLITSTNRISSPVIIGRVRSDSDIHESLRFCANCKRTPVGILTLSQAAFLHYVFSEIDTDDANEFMEQVLTGESLKRKMPAFAVRERLLGERVKTRNGKLEAVMRGWNAFRDGRTLAQVNCLGQLPALV